MMAVGPSALIIVMSSATALPADLVLDGPIRLEPRSVPQGDAAQLSLPALPPRPGRTLVLGLRAVILAAGEAGCNYNASVRLNGTPLGRRTAAGDERLLGREPVLELTTGAYPPFSVFSGGKLMVMFAPDADRGDAMTTDNLGATFLFDISDLARDAGPNTLSLRNEFPGKLGEGLGLLRVEDIQVGCVDPGKVPQPPNAVPERGPISATVAARGVRLAQSTRGGFAVRMGEGPELLIETAIGMRHDVPTALLADDGASAVEGVQVTTRRWGPDGFRIAATWPGLTLSRTVAIRNGLIEWRERWTNIGDTIRGVPFRHRFFLRGGPARCRLGGSDDSVALATSACNPTLFLEPGRQPGTGWGVTAESDWLRLLMGLRARAGFAEMLSDTLALAPGSSVDFDLTITPVGDGGGYWSFINALRERWGVNDITQERPVFWGYARTTDAGTPGESVAQSLAHLGAVYVVLGPWQRLEPDARVVREGTYPKLPPDAPRAPGACPDLDVDAFLTFAHREPYWAQLRQETQLIRRAAPNAKVMQMLHPSMEAVYRPLKDRWPSASEAILTPDGDVFESSHYSHAWLNEWADKDWGVLYYVPRPASVYLSMVLQGVLRGLDDMGLDGIYCDEFSWAFTRTGYSRYDYSRWDGHSADLDEDGHVVRLKSDNAFVTESCQLQMVAETLRRGRFFLGNGGNALRSLNRLPIARFIEGGNGAAAWPQGHLSATPLVLGNMGDETSRRGVFDSVKACLQEGCLYSPMAVNLLLEGPDNFVCKLYPMTVTELGPGWIIGNERLATTVSRAFDWPPTGGSVRLCRYGATGERLDADRTLQVSPGRSLTIEVPENGLVIAEGE